MLEAAPRDDEELRVAPDRRDAIAESTRALLADLRALEILETLDLEPVTNAKRWWLDAGQE